MKISPVCFPFNYEEKHVLVWYSDPVFVVYIISGGNKSHPCRKNRPSASWVIPRQIDREVTPHPLRI